MKNLTLLPMLFTLAACMSHIRYAGVDVPPRPAGERPVAYITNPELAQERAILEASRLYRLSRDAGAPNKITLAPLSVRGRCGNPLLASVFTLGLLPVVMRDSYTFGYTVEGPAGKQVFEHTVEMDFHYSLWELFFLFASDDRQLGRGVRAVALGAQPEGGDRPAPVAADVPQAAGQKR